jgi:hypothetical protein
MAGVAGFVSGFRAACLAALVAAAGGHDARAQAYAPPPLDTMFYTSETGGFRVVAVNPDTVITQSGQNRTTWIAGMLVYAVPAQDRARLDALFPLTPGARFDYPYTVGDTYKGRIELVVQSADTLDVNGKAMPVMRVTRRHKGLPPSTFEGVYTIWYSAAYGLPLKMSYQHISGDRPNFRDWQVVRIAAPGSLDGVWSFRVTCPFNAYLTLDRVTVRDGVIVKAASASPNGKSITQHDFRVTRNGDEIELKGSAMAAQLNPVTVSARGTLMPAGSVAGSAIANGRSGCSFSGERW